jgi:hypothetical protein
MGALRAELLSQWPAYPTAAAGDQDHPVLESQVHSVLLLVS